MTPIIAGPRNGEQAKVVIWDNLKPHHAAGARRAVEGAGALLMPLPPSSPDPTPIAERFSKVKGGLRSAATRTTEAVYHAMSAALRAVCRRTSWAGSSPVACEQPKGEPL
jgi:transposase